MFEGQPLSKSDYAKLKEFLDEQNEEGTRLDYKQEWVGDITRTACAFANTSGGDIIVGVKEVNPSTKKAGKANLPDPNNISGIDARTKDWKASAKGKIISNTRPPVVPEVELFGIPGKPGRAVLVVRIEESLDAPHEVHVSSTPEIPIRRGDSTQSIGLDDVERLIQRRDQIRQGTGPQLIPEFFEGSLGPVASYDPKSAGVPPTVAVAIRPRRLNSLRFDFDSTLDKEMEDLALECDLLDVRSLTPTHLGVTMKHPKSGTPRIHVEVRKEGTILSGWALEAEKHARIDTSKGYERTIEYRYLNFSELVGPLLATAQFAAKAYALVRPVDELEVRFGLTEVAGHHVMLEVKDSYPSYRGEVVGTSFGQRPVLANVAIRVDLDGTEVIDEDRLSLAREMARFFGLRAPDDRLQYYL